MKNVIPDINYKIHNFCDNNIFHLEIWDSLCLTIDEEI